MYRKRREVERGREGWRVSVYIILLFVIKQMRRRAGDVISLEDTRKRSYHRQVCIAPTVQPPHHILLVLLIHVVWFERELAHPPPPIQSPRRAFRCNIFRKCASVVYHHGKLHRVMCPTFSPQLLLVLLEP